MESEVIAGLSGVVLGSLLTGIGAWYRLQLERTAVLNRALYSLLELYRTILVVTGIDFRRALDVYIKCIEAKFPGVDSSKSRDQFEPMIRQMFASVLASQSQDYDSKMAERFTSQCDELASISPLLAARINGNRYLRSMLPALEEYLASVRRSINEPGTEEVLNKTDHATALVNQLISDELVEELQRDALHLAWKCSAMTWVRCKIRFSKQSRAKIQEQYEKRIGGWVDDLFDQMLSNQVEEHGRV